MCRTASSARAEKPSPVQARHKRLKHGSGPVQTVASLGMLNGADCACLPKGISVSRLGTTVEVCMQRRYANGFPSVAEVSARTDRSQSTHRTFTVRTRRCKAHAVVQA